jgi:hypothetical protein
MYAIHTRKIETVKGCLARFAGNSGIYYLYMVYPGHAYV